MKAMNKSQRKEETHEKKGIMSKSAEKVFSFFKISKKENIDAPDKFMKYRWFYTKKGKFVYGGKSSEHNDETIKYLLNEKKVRMIMHTKNPGSPFAIVNDYVGSVTLEDMKETAVWTACFSRAWRDGLKKTVVDIFLSEQLVKKDGMNTGSFSVVGEIDRMGVELKLVLCKQKGVLRAVPENSAEGKVLGVIAPGDIPKEDFAEQLAGQLKLNKDEILNALPTGGFKLVGK